VPPVYSHSRLACFENCPKQFHYRYVLKIPAETESIEAFLGKRVHEVIERLHRFVGRGMVPSLAKVLARFRSNWRERYHPERVRIVREGTDEGSYVEIGERCLRHFYRTHYPFDGDETLDVETRVRFALDEQGDYRLQGVIDRLARAPDGTVEIHDYKTARRVPPQHRLDQDRQLALYQLGVQGAHPEAPIRLVWHYLAVGATRVSTRSPEELDALRRETVELIRRIEGEERFEPRPGPLCGWCEYREICPAAPRAASATAPPARPPAPAAPGAAGAAGRGSFGRL